MEKNGGMRGTPERQLSMLSSLSTEDLIPVDHPIRRIRVVVDTVLAGMDASFEAMYAKSGRPSVPPEQLLKASVLMAVSIVTTARLPEGQRDTLLPCENGRAKCRGRNVNHEASSSRRRNRQKGFQVGREVNFR